MRLRLHRQHLDPLSHLCNRPASVKVLQSRFRRTTGGIRVITHRSAASCRHRCDKRSGAGSAVAVGISRIVREGKPGTFHGANQRATHGAMSARECAQRAGSTVGGIGAGHRCYPGSWRCTDCCLRGPGARPASRSRSCSTWRTIAAATGRSRGRAGSPRNTDAAGRTRLTSPRWLHRVTTDGAIV